MKPKFKVDDVVKHIHGNTTWVIAKVKENNYLLKPGPTIEGKYPHPTESIRFYKFDPEFELEQGYKNVQKLKKVLGL